MNDAVRRPLLPRRPTRIDRRRAGISLVELLVTIVLLAVGLVGVSSMFTAAYKTQVQANFATVATDIATTRLEEMKAVGYSGIDEDTFPPEFHVPELPSGRGTITFDPYPDADSAHQYLIAVNIEWGGGPGIAGHVSMNLVLSNHA